MHIRTLEEVSEESIRSLLVSARIDVDVFGGPGTKTLGDLAEESRNRDVVVVIDECGRVLRTALNVKVIILGGPRDDQNRPTLRLQETKRVFDDGTVREKLKPYGLSETRKRGETSMAALCRGLREEFGFDDIDPTDFTSILHDHEDIHESSVYPGIMSVVWSSWYEWHMPLALYRPEGYVAREACLSVHTEWFPIL